MYVSVNQHHTDAVEVFLLTISGYIGVERATENVPTRLLVWGPHGYSSVQCCDAELCT